MAPSPLSRSGQRTINRRGSGRQSHALLAVPRSPPRGESPFVVAIATRNGLALPAARAAERSAAANWLLGRLGLERGLEAEDRLGVELRDARLGHAQHLADLAQREVLVVVERHDQLLALGQPRDGVGQAVLGLG